MHCGQVHPSPANDLEVGKIGLPHLVGLQGRRLEAVSGLDHQIGRAGYQVMRLFTYLINI